VSNCPSDPELPETFNVEDVEACQDASRRVIVISRAGHLYGLDPGSGKKLWSQNNVIGAAVDSTPALETP
jgi:outer membrane protein assembly factor BamB